MESVEIRGNKSTRDLLREAGLFLLHTVIAVAALAIVVAAFWIARADPDSSRPKILGTVLAFFVPMLVSFLIFRVRKDNVAGFVWISGMIFFLVVCVYVLDLPTGPGLCEHCGLLERLYRTFFSIDNNSGMLGGDGLLIGSWIPLSIIGYAVGAKVGSSVE